jgi:hypothetical protein
MDFPLQEMLNTTVDCKVHNHGVLGLLNTFHTRQQLLMMAMLLGFRI